MATPCSPVHEKAFISCLMQDTVACGGKAINTFGSVNPCFTPECSSIYDAIMQIDLHKIDLMTVVDYLVNANKIDACGGITGIRDIINTVPSVAQFNLHMAWVGKLSQQRAVLKELESMQAKLQDPRVKLDEVVDSSDVAIRRALSTMGKQTVMSMDEAAEDALHGLDEDVDTMKLGLASVDDLIGEMPIGSLILLAARPGCGKTTLAGNIALSHAAVQNPVYFASLEMPRRQLLGRWVCSLTDTFSSSLRLPERRAVVEAGYKMLSGLPMYVDDKPSLTISEFIRKAKRLKAEFGVRVVVLDYLQRMNLEDRKGENRDQTVTRAAVEIKNMLLELGMIGIVLVQFNRQAADGAPAVHHLRESGGLEQEADYVLMLDADKMSKEQLGPINAGRVAQKIRLIVGKNRHGPQGIVEIDWWKPFSRFEANRVDDCDVPK